MTNASIEELAQLIHRESLLWAAQHRPDWRTVSWEMMAIDHPDRQEQYRAVARAVLRKLGR